ncbi:hypothetical protein ACKWTF_001585 [Chironomus riparius]
MDSFIGILFKARRPKRMFCKAGITFIILLIQGIHGFKTNLFLNLSTIENKGGMVFATYKTRFLINDIFRLPFGNDDFLIVEDLFGSSLNKIKFNFVKFVTIKIGDNAWNLTESRNNFTVKLCRNFFQFIEINFDEVLNTVFQCYDPVKGYKSQFYQFNYTSRFFFNTSSYSKLEFFDGISTYWLVTHSKLQLMNNERNFREFLKKCYSIPGRFYFFIVIAIVIIYVVVAQIIFHAINQEYYSDIFFQRALNSVIIARPVRIFNAFQK